ncbi:MAG: DUF3280 domain-containing protein [Methylocystis sp.]|nr:DUF3280 domain-containing protein [Methylocystis sp.]
MNAIGRRAILAAITIATPFAAHAETLTGKRLLVLGFDMLDTSQEPVDQRADHERRLARLRDDVAAGLAAKRVYEIVDRAPSEKALVETLARTYLRTCNGCDIEFGRQTSADFVLLGQVNKVSTLIMSMDVTIKSVKLGQPLYSQRFDFRGDNDKAWERATKYVIERIARDPVM